MADNPFESPQRQPVEAQVAHPGKTNNALPGPALAISIICLILGVLGLFGLCFQGLALGFQSSLMEFADSVPQPPAQKEFNRLNMAAQQSMLIPAIVLMATNLFVAGLLVAGGIGCLKRTSSGRSTLRLGLLAAIFYSLLKLALTIASYFVTMGAIRKGVSEYQGNVPIEQFESLVTAGNIGAIVGCVIGSLFIVALAIFYLWARFYMGKDKLDPYFTS